MQMLTQISPSLIEFGENLNADSRGALTKNPIGAIKLTLVEEKEPRITGRKIQRIVRSRNWA